MPPLLEKKKKKEGTWLQRFGGCWCLCGGQARGQEVRGPRAVQGQVQRVGWRLRWRRVSQPTAGGGVATEALW